MMENENITTEIIEEIACPGMEENAESTSGMNAGFAMLIGSAMTVAAIAIVKGITKGIEALRAKKQNKQSNRPDDTEPDDDITEDDLDIKDIEP